MMGTIIAMLWLFSSALSGPADAPSAGPAPPALSDEALLTEVQRRAFRFFWEQSDAETGLTNDRARNIGPDSGDTVASVASTGYALAALPVAVEHKWVTRDRAYRRAEKTLRFLRDRMPNQHGWYFHFVDKRTGERVWKCELSSIDTALLMEGVLICGRYWRGTEVEQIASALYARMDWTWMRTNGGEKPDKRTLCMGWKPEEGFLKSEWSHYCELMFLYLLGLGAQRDPLPADSWTAWQRDVVEYGGRRTLAGGPIFLHQMAHGYYDFRDQRDSSGWDYWVSSVEATQINRQFCLDRADRRKTYGPDIWGLNACDGPDGYTAYGAPGEEDGTVSPTGAIASLSFTPELSKAAAQAMYTRYGDRLWGRYGFSDAFNLDRDWFDPDVIGIDLGMALVAIENYRTGLIWRLAASHPGTQRAWKRAGFHKTQEPDPRPLRR
jgi:hypothetical protein